MAEGKREFANAILRLFADKNLRRSLGERGRATVVEHYSWEAKARQMESLLLAAAGLGPSLRAAVPAAVPSGHGDVGTSSN